MKTLLGLLFVLLSFCESRAGQYYNLNGIKYFISHPMVHNWYEADRFCTFNAMYPATIQSFEDEQLVTVAIKQFRTEFNLTATVIHFWTSGTDLGHPVNEFYWSTTGYPVIYKNWISGYPINGEFQMTYKGTRDCLLLNGDYNHQWFDEYCALRYPVICQDKLTMPRRFIDTQCEL